ncbi:YcxB family protein [Flavitalea flava]
MAPIIISFRLRLNELFSANYYVVTRRVIRKSTLLIPLIGIGAAIVLELVLTSDRTFDWASLLNYLIPLAIFFFIFLLAIYLAAAFNYYIHPANFTHLVYQFNFWGLTISNNTGDSAHPWRSLDCRETKTCFLFFLTRYKAIVLPKRVFETKEEEERFLSLLEEQLGSPTRPTARR